jgi:hypothetical protein
MSRGAGPEKAAGVQFPPGSRRHACQALDRIVSPGRRHSGLGRTPGKAAAVAGGAAVSVSPSSRCRGPDGMSPQSKFRLAQLRRLAGYEDPK